MTIKDSKGNEVEIQVSGNGDDVEIDSIQYTDSDSDVPDSEVDYILDKYAAELEFMALERLIGASEAYYEGDR